MSAQPHPYAEILRAIADGKQVQWQERDGPWVDQSWEATLHEISDEDYKPYRYRIKPATITINGHEVPEPLREMPQTGTQVYWPSFSASADDDWVESVEVGYYEQVTTLLLRNGMLHLTQEAAVAHARALLSFTTKEGAAA